MDRKRRSKRKHGSDHTPSDSSQDRAGKVRPHRGKRDWTRDTVDERTVADRRHKIGRRRIDRPSVVKIALLTFITIVIGVFEEFGDPFGVASFTDNLSATIYNNVMSPFYGKEDSIELTLDKNSDKKAELKTRFGQKQVVVIIIDDHYLKASNQSWPLAPSRYKRLLRNLSNAGSAAVFFDIYLARQNADKEAQIASLYAYTEQLKKNGGTPIVFASTLDDPAPVANGTQAPDYALAQMNVEPGFYSFNVKDKIPDHDTPSLVPEPSVTPTAAWRLYQHWCEHNEALCGDKPIPDDVQAGGTDDDGTNDLYIQWGGSPNQLMTSVPEFGGSLCQEQALGFWSKFWHSAQVFYRDGTQGLSDDEHNACTYTTQINLRVVKHLSTAEFEELFKNKVVLIGTSLSLHQDLYFSPAQGYVPGVFWHAMALDNMIEYGKEYRQKISSTVGSSMESIVLALILIVQAIMSWILHNPYFSEELETRLQMRHSLFLLCVISCVVVYTAGILNWAPANWVGIAILVLIIDAGPVKVLPKYSWRKRPFQSSSASNNARWRSGISSVTIFSNNRANRVLTEVVNVLASVVIFMMLVAIGLLIFILPNANIVSREYHQQAVSWGFLILYGAVAGYCLIYCFMEYVKHRRSEC